MGNGAMLGMTKWAMERGLYFVLTATEYNKDALQQEKQDTLKLAQEKEGFLTESSGVPM